jgi:hypothetical protein
MPEPVSHLKFNRRPLGLLINFNLPVFKDGIIRLVSGGLFQKCEHHDRQRRVVLDCSHHRDTEARRKPSPPYTERCIQM